MKQAKLWTSFIASVAILCLITFTTSISQVRAQEGARHETRSGVLEFLPNGYPTEETVKHVRTEVEYQRAVQAYIHWLPAVGIMPWRNGHYKLGG